MMQGCFCRLFQMKKMLEHHYFEFKMKLVIIAGVLLCLAACATADLTFGDDPSEPNVMTLTLLPDAIQQFGARCLVGC